MVRLGMETEYGVRGQVIDAETHAPISNASMIKLNPNADLDDRNKPPMAWHTTRNGEFWRLILPGKYTLEVRMANPKTSLLFDYKLVRCSTGTL